MHSHICVLIVGGCGLLELIGGVAILFWLLRDDQVTVKAMEEGYQLSTQMQIVTLLESRDNFRR